MKPTITSTGGRASQAVLKQCRTALATDEMRRRIAELEVSLAEAHSGSERARAMAEMTKPGYVYIISNIGSFGEDVVKIGLTRRLDPDDRVRELGDASVPFSFDTHAMIYSDEAPALEGALHREFADRRINMSNFRKEFFRVKLEEVEEAVARLAPSAAFFKDREAQEWHETLARRNQALQDMAAPEREALPASLGPATHAVGKQAAPRTRPAGMVDTNLLVASGYGLRITDVSAKLPVGARPAPKTAAKPPVVWKNSVRCCSRPRFGKRPSPHTQF